MLQPSKADKRTPIYDILHSLDKSEENYNGYALISMLLAHIVD